MAYYKTIYFHITDYTRWVGPPPRFDRSPLIVPRKLRNPRGATKPLITAMNS